jgi:biotin synthase
MTNIVNKLRQNRDLSADDLKALIESDEIEDELFKAADHVRRENYDTAVYIRGLIECTNYCRNNCFYCGIRCDNKNLERYRLTKEEVLSCCHAGYELGFRTFVLQGGEDLIFAGVIAEIVKDIKTAYPDCAVTLSFGEMPSYFQAWFDAGADRYLLRHETADTTHYQLMHPNNMCYETRKNCLMELKKIGYQVGAGFMVGSPHQTVDMIIADLRYLQDLKPDMIGIGPYISHQNTPFSSYQSGDLHLTLRLIAILRLLFPDALIPATTALGTIDRRGREMGLKAGANVVMPNLSPLHLRKQYELYDNKLSSGAEAAEYLKDLKELVAEAGYLIVEDVGHRKGL